MNIIDARSGRQRLGKGDVIQYGGGDWMHILDTRIRLFSGRVLITGPKLAAAWVPLTVRFFHPSFFGRRVGFIPS